MEGLRNALDNDQLDDFVADFYNKLGRPVPALEEN
jgi:hypothetical protein